MIFVGYKYFNISEDNIGNGSGMAWGKPIFSFFVRGLCGIQQGDKHRNQ